MAARSLHLEPRNPVPDDAVGLAALEARLAEDLSRLNHPPAGWMKPTFDRAGARVLDVAIIGGGMCGLAAAFALRRQGIADLRLLDRSPAGREGPWLSYARMETLRSPKQLTGPAAGMASLTFRAWYEARFGRDAWARLFRIPRPMWGEYLAWYRWVLDVPVENGVEVRRIGPRDGLLRLELGRGDALLARKVVLATGREGLGAPSVPDFVEGLERGVHWAHSSDAIDFATLRGRRVVVVGVGASGVDNAATALEAGAAEVRLLARRREMPRINKLMGIGGPGFTSGFPALDPAWRWRIMRYSFTTQTPPPRDSTLRVSRYENASFHFGCAVERVVADRDTLRVAASGGRTFMADFLILGTGFTVDPLARPELGEAAAGIATWADRYNPPPELAHAELARFPWLAADFALTEREPGTLPWLSDVHCFNYAASLSLGKVSGDIPAIGEGAAWLAERIAGEFYRRDIEHHWQVLQDYAKPELLGDEWTDAEAG